MWRVRSCGGVSDPMELAEIPHLSIEKLLSSVTHEILGSSMPAEPLENQGIGHFLPALVLQETASFETAKNINEI